MVARGKTYKGAIIIPKSITYGGGSSGLGNSGFDILSNSSNSVTANVIGIEDLAFYGCTGLTSVNIPNSVISIGTSAFCACKSLTSINIPNSVTSIGSTAFYGCTDLTSVNIPNSVTSIGDGAFSGCTGLISVNIPDSVKIINESLFYGCKGLTNITIPNTVTSIGKNAFNGCSGLKSITIPNSVTSIEEGGFEGCAALKSVSIPDSVKRISSRMFYACTELKNITIPNSVISIGAYAFSGCTGLTSVNIPNSVTSIGDEAFSGCTGLTSVKIPNSVTSILQSAFSGCTGLRNINIPNEVNYIGNYAFSGCTGLKNISIPSSVSIIGNGILSGVDMSVLKIYVAYKIYKWGYILEGLNVDTIYVNNHFVKSVSEACPNAKVIDWNNYWGVGVQSRSFSIASPKNNEYQSDESTEEIQTRFILNTVEVQPVDKNGRYVFLGLDPDREYTLAVGKYNSSENAWIDSYTTLYIKTLPALKTSTGNPTQTTFTTFVSFGVDSNYVEKPSLCEIELYDKYGKKVANQKFKYETGGRYVTFTGLIPNETYTLYYVDNLVNGTEKRFKIRDVQTSRITPYINSQTVGVTTATIKAIANNGDATIAESYWVLPDYLGGNQTGDVLELNGLNPNSTYTFTYVVKTKEGNKTFQARKEVRTSSLELVTETKAKATSNSVALICANTNIDNSEVNTGFEWRRYDAPDLVPSEQAACPVIDGVMTGALKNLSASTYYKFRPFYKARSGQMYYGEWSAFGTADAYVYFDPTVRTYAAVVLNSKSIQVKGYAIAGSDEIIEQGFEYWKTGSAKVAKRILANSTTDSTTDEGKQTIAATGQWMSATIEGLTPATTYAVRAFVRTAKGTTYGEEQTFTTPVASGIELPTTQEGKLSVSLIRANAGTLNFSVTGADNSAKWKLYSVSGTMVAGGNVNSENEVQQTNLPQLTPGVYLLNVSDQDDACSLRIIIR